MRRTLTMLAMASLVASLAIPIGATTIDKRTSFTFNQPITLPGVTLPAGTYTFRLADPDTGSAIEITNERGTESYAIVLAKPIARPSEEENKKATVQFLNTPSGMTSAVEAWWSEGDKMGYQLVYPERQHMLLTQAQGVSAQPELALAANTTPPAADFAPVSPREEQGRVAQSQTPASPRAAAQDPATSPAPSQQQPGATDPSVRETLPRTAGFLPLALIGGMGAIAAGLWMSRRAARPLL